MLGDAGEVLPAFNPDGAPRQKSDESWHSDVFIEEVGRITGYAKS